MPKILNFFFFFWNRCTGTKVPKWQSGYFLPNCHFGTFFPVYRFQNFFLQNDFWLSIMKELFHIFAEKVSQALSRPVHVLTWEDKLNHFKFPTVDFKNSFFFVIWDHFGSLGCRIGECPFFYISILLLGSVGNAKNFEAVCLAHLDMFLLCSLNLK